MTIKPTDNNPEKGSASSNTRSRVSRTSALHALQMRVADLEAEKAVRQCMNRYMHLCDGIGVGFDLDEIMDLFTETAVWEGVGDRYAKSLGLHRGRAEIRHMFSKYTKPPAHFDMNVHILGNEVISVEGDTGQGHWVLVQPSSFVSGKSQLSCARIEAQFERQEEMWRIAHFQTRNLFSRPMDKPWDDIADLPVPE